MRRRWLIVGSFLVVAASAALTGFLRYSAQNEEQRAWVPVKWQVTRISRDQRRLELLFASGGCTRDRGRARVRESAARVRIRVEANEAVKLGAEFSCTADLRSGRADVRLRRPLGGRTLEGMSRAIPGFGGIPFASEQRGERLVGVVPRVAGLRADDAAALLTAGGFTLRPLRPSDRRREAAGTRPVAGTELRATAPDRVALQFKRH